jgi:tetratricopeptide (TPR) repeat protein
LALQVGECLTLADYDAALVVGDRALAIGTALGDQVIKVRARSHLGQTHHFLGDFARARRLFEESLEELGQDPDRTSRMFNYYGLSHVRLAGTLRELGEFARGLAYLEETAEICRARENWWGIIFGLNARGLIHYCQCDFRGATLVLEESLELCRSRDFPALITPTAAILGYAYAFGGRPADGVPLLEQSLRDAEPLAMACNQAQWSVWLGESYLLAAKLDDAATAGRRALALAVQRKERAQEAYAERLLAGIASRAHPLDVAEAERHYHRAASLGEELGMRPLLAHCHLGLGKLYLAAGKRQDALERVTIAATMYREMDMRFWLEQADALVGR